MPVGVVVSLLGALVAAPVPVGVLAGVDGRAGAEVIGAQALVGGEKT